MVTTKEVIHRFYFEQVLLTYKRLEVSPAMACRQKLSIWFSAMPS